MPDPNLTPYLRLNLDSDADMNRNWALLDARLMDLAARLVQNVIGPGMIQQSMLAKPSVGTPELLDLSVTTPKLADLAVTAAKIADATITAAKIQSVNWTSIVGAPTSLPPSGGAGGDLTGTYPNPQLQNGAVDYATLAADVSTRLPPLPTGVQTGFVLTATSTMSMLWQAPTGGGAGGWVQDPGTGQLKPALPTQGLLFDSGAEVTWTSLPAPTRRTGIKADDNSLILHGGSQGIQFKNFDSSQVLAYLDQTGMLTLLNGLAANSLNASALKDAPNGVPTVKINDLAITTAKIADLAVTDAKISAVAWAKVTGAPTSFPPSGTAGGSLTGTYPNPTLAANSVAGATIQSGAVQPVKFNPAATAGDVGKMVTISSTTAFAYTAVPTSLPPSGSAGGDLQGTYPNPQIATGAIVDADVSATAGIQYTKLSGTPTSLPPSGAAGGDLQGTYPNPTIKPASLPWTPSGAILTPTDATKRVAIPGPTTAVDQSQLVLGTRIIKAHVESAAGIDFAAFGLNAYYDGSAWRQDDNTKPSWFLYEDVGGDNAGIQRIPAGGSNSALFLVRGSDGKTVCTLADVSVTRPMLAVSASAAAANRSGVNLPVNFANATPNAWLKVVDCPALTTRGGPVLLFASIGGFFTVNPTGGAIYLAFYKNGAIILGYRYDIKSPTTANTQWAVPGLSFWDTPAAGTYTYSLYVFQATNTAFGTGADNSGQMWAQEFS